MKTPIAIILLTVIALTMGGCFLVPGYAKAKETYEATEAEYAKALTSLERAGTELEEVVKNYEAAIVAGDTTKAEALKAAVLDAVTRYRTAEDTARDLKSAFDVTVTEFKKAKSAEDYIGTTLGLIGSVFGGLFGLGAMRKRSAAVEATEGATSLVEKLKSGVQWDKARDAVIPSLSPAARKVIEAVRP